MDLIYLMLNDKGQTEPFQLVNANGIPQPMDASDPRVAQLNTGSGSGRPVRVLNSNNPGEYVEAMQLTEFHYFVNENNKVIPVPPGSIVHGEFEDEEEEEEMDTAKAELQENDQCLNDMGHASDECTKAAETAEAVTVENEGQNEENLNVSYMGEEQGALNVPMSIELNSAAVYGSGETLHVHGDEETTAMDNTGDLDVQNTTETIFTQDEIELEEEVVSLQVSEAEVVTHRSPVKHSKRNSNASGSHDHTVGARESKKNADAVGLGEAHIKSPSKKSKRKQILESSETQADVAEKTSVQLIKKGPASPLETHNSLSASDTSIVDTGRPKRSVPRRSVLEMLHGDGKASSRRHGTSSGSDSEVDGCATHSSGKRHHSKGTEKQTKPLANEKPARGTLQKSKTEEPSRITSQFPSALAMPTSSNQKIVEGVSQNSGVNAAGGNVQSQIPTEKRGRGRRRKVVPATPQVEETLETSRTTEKDLTSVSLPASTELTVSIEKCIAPTADKPIDSRINEPTAVVSTDAEVSCPVTETPGSFESKESTESEFVDVVESGDKLMEMQSVDVSSTKEETVGENDRSTNKKSSKRGRSMNKSSGKKHLSISEVEKSEDDKKLDSEKGAAFTEELVKEENLAGDIAASSEVAVLNDSIKMSVPSEQSENISDEISHKSTKQEGEASEIVDPREDNCSSGTYQPDQKESNIDFQLKDEHQIILQVQEECKISQCTLSDDTAPQSTENVSVQMQGDSEVGTEESVNHDVSNAVVEECEPRIPLEKTVADELLKKNEVADEELVTGSKDMEKKKPGRGRRGRKSAAKEKVVKESESKVPVCSSEVANSFPGSTVNQHDVCPNIPGQSTTSPNDVKNAAEDEAVTLENSEITRLSESKMLDVRDTEAVTELKGSSELGIVKDALTSEVESKDAANENPVDHDDEDIRDYHQQEMFLDRENGSDAGMMMVGSDEENERDVNVRNKDSGEELIKSMLQMLENSLKHANMTEVVETSKAVEEGMWGHDNKTILLMLAELEHLAEEIRSKMASQGQNEEEDSEQKQSWRTGQKSPEGRLRRIVDVQLLKLRALDRELDERSSQLMVARGQLNRKESQLKQTETRLERNQMLLELEKEALEDDRKKLMKEKEAVRKERKLYTKLKESRKRKSDVEVVQSKSNKKARDSGALQPSTATKERRTLFEEMSAIKETKSLALVEPSPIPSSHSHGGSHSTSLSRQTLSELEAKDLAKTECQSPGEVPAAQRSANEKGNIPKSKVSLTPCSMSTVVKGKKELLRRFEADELNSPTEETKSSKSSKLMKSETPLSLTSHSMKKSSQITSKSVTSPVVCLTSLASLHSDQSIPVKITKDASSIGSAVGGTGSKSRHRDSLLSPHTKKRHLDGKGSRDKAVKTYKASSKEETNNLACSSDSSSKKKEIKRHKRSS